MSPSALGLAVSGLPVADLGPAAAARTLRLAAAEGLGPPPGARVLVDRRDAAGAPFLRVLDAGADGLHIEAAGHGAHRLAADGRSARSTAPHGYDARWQALVHAQLLPSAAALQGLEPLHAAGVVAGPSAVGLVAAPGGGKSTLAAALVEAGAGFLADDVLAVEADGDTVLAHPGPARIMREAEGAGAAKLAVPMAVPGGAVPLGRLCFLARSRRIAAARLEPLEPPDPRLLLGASFVGFLAGRRVAHLEAAARLAALVPCARLLVPDPLTPAAARALLEDLCARP